MNNKIMIIAAVIAIGIGAFYGGTIYEKSSLSKQGLLRNGNSQLANSQRRGQGQGFQRDGSNGDSGGFVAGEIISKDDKSITVKTRDGGSKIIFFSGSTSVGKAAEGTFADLASGEQVMVNGTTNSDGTVTAQNIQIRPDQVPMPGQGQ